MTVLRFGDVSADMSDADYFGYGAFFPFGDFEDVELGPERLLLRDPTSLSTVTLLGRFDLSSQQGAESSVCTAVALRDGAGRLLYEWSGFEVGFLDLLFALATGLGVEGLIEELLRGADSVLGGAGDDLLYGGGGADSVAGGGGDDALFGDAGGDVLDGGEGDDALLGDSGEDLLDGGPGDDLLDGGAGDDRLRGGDGADVLSALDNDGLPQYASVAFPVQAYGFAAGPSVSADGRWVAFVSTLETLVAGDTNGWRDVFVANLEQGTVVRASVSTGGGQGGAGSYWPSLSGDGTRVAFVSDATDLVAGGGSHAGQAYVKDLATGALTRVSERADGTVAGATVESPVISADGSTVVFRTQAGNLADADANGTWDLFAKDLGSGALVPVSTNAAGEFANSYSYHPAVSADGRYVAFSSAATNLVAGDGNGLDDVFVKDLATGAVQRIAPMGVPGFGIQDRPWVAISSSGRHVAFVSWAPDVVPGDTNGFADVFVADRIDGTIRRASVTDEGLQADGPSGAPALAADGRWVLFESSAANLRAQAVGAPLGLFARGLTPGAETTVALPAPTAVAAGTVTHPAISAGGERVAWLGGVAGDLVGLSSWQTAGADTLEGGPGDDVFLLNREAQLVEADGGGVDAVITDAPRHVLAEHVENLAYRGHGSFHGVGNSLGNLIGGGGGDDLLDGLTGPQRDTVRYAGARAAFEVQVLQAADHATDRAVRVRDGSGAQGTDTLLSIERLVFDDLTLAFDTAPGEAAATAFALWHAAFGRAPLPSEIGRWIDALDGGAAADSVAASMLQAYAPSVPNVLLVQVLYTNIVGSPPPDAQAIAPFVEPLDQGLLTQAQLFAAAAASALNEVRIAGLVADGVAFESWAG